MKESNASVCKNQDYYKNFSLEQNQRFFSLVFNNGKLASILQKSNIISLIGEVSSRGITKVYNRKAISLKISADLSFLKKVVSYFEFYSNNHHDNNKYCNDLFKSLGIFFETIIKPEKEEPLFKKIMFLFSYDESEKYLLNTHERDLLDKYDLYFSSNSYKDDHIRNSNNFELE